MRHILSSLLILLFGYTLIQAQTNANIAGPENVLVVYNSNSSIQDSVMQSYITARNIPYPTNVIDLNLPDSVQISVDQVTHWVGIRQGTDVIRDIYNHNGETWFPTYHAWQYYYTYIASPILTHLQNNNLTNTIRYIVLCKGVPFKIQAAGDFSSANANVTVESLLCMLNTDNYEDLIQDIYEVYHQHSQPDPNYNHSPIVPNPYYSGTYGIDPNYNFNWRFSTDHFTLNWSGHTVKLSYLVSHIDGVSYNVVKGMIDRSADPDMSGNATWVIDDDPSLGYYSYFTNTKNRLETYGFNVVYNNTNNWITSYAGDIMGYSSKGTHAEDGNCSWEDSAWVVDSLQFDWANGALYNSLESFNGQSLSTLSWRYVPRTPPYCNHTQGLATESTIIGASSSEANGWEPVSVPGYNAYFLNFAITYPAYAMGYSVVDAIYMGLPYLTWVNAVVGDPLTTIAWGKQTTTQNIELTSTNLVTDTIHISPGDTVLFADDSNINLKHHGFVVSNESSVLKLGKDVILNSDSWDRGLLLADSADYPQLIWVDNPSMSPIDYYKIYRKFDATSWTFIDSVTENTWVDTSLTFRKGNGTAHDSVYYYVKSFNSTSSSDPSNTVAAKLGITVSADLPSGWQIVSVPVIPESYAASSVFPTHIGTIYAYVPGSGYVAVSTLENGPGYWADFDSEQTVYHSGLAIDSLSVTVPSGWSFLGSISYNITVSDVTTDPTGTISSIYKYVPGTGYVLMNGQDIIQPGIGYWLNASQSGLVILSKTYGMQKSTSLSDIDLADLDKFTITDSLGNEQSLYVANIDMDSTLESFDRAMPPPMPELGMDARFNYGEFIKVVSTDSGLVDLEIDIESIAYPVTLSWDLNPENGLEYSFPGDTILNKMSKIRDNKSQISFSKNSNGRIRLFGKISDSFTPNQIPKEFALEQNYPNPFNPTTTIKYSLAKDEFVTLEVYDILGARVAQIVNQQQKAGNYTVEFNASKLSSGVYFYKINTRDFSNTRKMLLIK